MDEVTLDINDVIDELTARLANALRENALLVARLKAKERPKIEEATDVAPVPSANGSATGSEGQGNGVVARSIHGD